MHLHYGDLIDGNSLVKIVSDTKPTEIYNLGAQSHVKVIKSQYDYWPNNMRGFNRFVPQMLWLIFGPVKNFSKIIWTSECWINSRNLSLSHSRNLSLITTTLCTLHWSYWRYWSYCCYTLKTNISKSGLRGGQRINKVLKYLGFLRPCRVYCRGGRCWNTETTGCHQDLELVTFREVLPGGFRKFIEWYI